MTEYIDRSALGIGNAKREAFTIPEYADGWNSAIKIIDNAPTVDAVPVVRCKDCAKDGLFSCPMCYIESHKLIFINHDPEFFCAYGERKEGADNG